MKLYVTYCSAEKREGIHPPDRLYISDRITRFVEKCKSIDVNWAIFSALYTLFFPEQKKEKYDVTFRSDKHYWLGIRVIKDGRKLSNTQSKQHMQKVITKLRQQAKDRNINEVIFFGPSPKMMKCYLGILHYVFDRCPRPHGWQELIEHVKSESKVIKVIHRTSLMSSD